MSQLLCRISKISSSKQRLCFSELRCLSTATTPTPYLLLEDTNHRAAATSGNERVVDMNLYDPSKDNMVKTPNQTLSEELSLSVRIGSSRGWVGLKNLLDFKVRLTNVYNPCASVSSHKVITLPPLGDGKTHLASFSLSASLDQEDCVVAVKSHGPFVNLCRPGDSLWKTVKVPFFSELMYSARDGKFYVHHSGKEEYDDDLIKSSSPSGFPEVSLHQSFPNSDIPKSRQDQVVSSLTTEFLVESPSSGDSFIVYWCNNYMKKEDREPYRKPKTFVVLRQDREKRMSTYTEDIGDLCIFIGKSEAFCVCATEYPWLKPNSIYYAGVETGFGIYDISSHALNKLMDEAPLSSTFAPWLAPLQ